MRLWPIIGQMVIAAEHQLRPLRIASSSAVYVVGSINVDHMYQCPEVLEHGKCKIAPEYSLLMGGKGLNQAFALFQVLSYFVMHFPCLGWCIESKISRVRR
jgi:hypothetical protein